METFYVVYKEDKWLAIFQTKEQAQRYIDMIAIASLEIVLMKMEHPTFYPVE